MSLARLRDPAVLADPYPLYRRLRDENPVHHDVETSGWLISRYDDVLAMLHDGRLVRSRGDQLAGLPAAEREALRPLYGVFGKQMLFVDPPDHTRLRGLVSKALLDEEEFPGMN